MALVQSRVSHQSKLSLRLLLFLFYVSLTSSYSMHLCYPPQRKQREALHHIYSTNINHEDATLALAFSHRQRTMELAPPRHSCLRSFSFDHPARHIVAVERNGQSCQQQSYLRLPPTREVFV